MHADDQVGEGVHTGLAAFLRGAVDGRPVQIAPSVCEGRGGRVFFVLVNASGAERECFGCDSRAFIADSEENWNEESWEDDEPGAARKRVVLQAFLDPPGQQLAMVEHGGQRGGQAARRPESS
ncbi:hypothetical protein ACFU53_31790 [Streptomyces sp. NPDC057474]|uniref:hypothetical protein n=1 Tax=Streptomyces sp. NPDC057474 TaxID=3346144 RepID=UPI0036A0BFE5